MELLLPIYRLVHFLGLALLFGGTLSSVILVRGEKPSVEVAKTAWTCMHLLAAPGFILLLLTGILQSATLYWEHFKGAGYMHAKVALATVLLGLMAFDMRTQKKIIRNNPETEILVDMLKKRQALALGICALTLLIMWLISFRPF